MKKPAQGGWRKYFPSWIIRAVEGGSIFPKLLLKAFKHAGEVNLPMMAGSLAFTTVLSIAPLLAVLFYVFKVFGGLDYAYDKLMPFILDNLSEGTGEVVEVHLGNFIRQVHAKAVGWIGIAGLLVTSLLTYFTIVKAFNKIWHVDRPHSIQHRIARALLLISVGPVLMTASVVITTAIATQVHVIPFSGHIVAFALSTMVFSMIYGLVPMVRVPARAIAIGSLLPALLWELAKVGYAIYTKKVMTYSAFYGSFAAFPLFLLWIYIAWYITLFGGVWVRTLQLHIVNSRRS